MSKIIRKPDNQRQNIHLATFNAIVKFLEEQKEPIFKTEIVKNIGVDYNSLKFALKQLEDNGRIKTDEEGRIKITKQKR